MSITSESLTQDELTAKFPKLTQRPTGVVGTSHTVDAGNKHTDPHKHGAELLASEGCFLGRQVLLGAGDMTEL